MALFALHFHFTPQQVDDLTLPEFETLTRALDKIVADQKKQEEEARKHGKS